MIDISQPLAQICEAFDVEPRNVRSITLHASDGITVETYRLLNGRKYVADANGEPVAGRYKGQVAEPVGAAMETIHIDADQIRWTSP